MVGALINTTISSRFRIDKKFSWNRILKQSKTSKFVDCDPYGSWPWGAWELPGIAKFAEVRDLHIRIIPCSKQDIPKVEEKLSHAVSEFFSCNAAVQIRLDQNLVNVILQTDLKNSPMRSQIEYYEFPNGEIIKRIQYDGVYRLDPITKQWNSNDAVTSMFVHDELLGKPCKNLRQKVDMSCDLPPFPCEGAFFPGSTVMIGAYPQKSTYDYSPIPWLVLKTTETTALCISKDCLITSGYCDPQTAYGKPELLWWENSEARNICNHHFFDAAFSEAEKARIIPRITSEVQLGKKCVDSVFLLSEQEVRYYFPTAIQRKSMPTPFAIQTGARLGWTDDTREYTSWWILPEENAYGQDGAIYPKAVFQMGEIQFHGRNAYHLDFTIRPCIQIRYK